MPDEKQPTILITDDDRIQRAILKSIIENKFDVNILEAENGQDAIDILEDKANIIDAITIDWEMPVLTGIDAVKIIHQKHPQIKILMITGSVSDEKKHTALQAGARDFIKKPIKPNKLILKISQMLKRAPKNND